MNVWLKVGAAVGVFIITIIALYVWDHAISSIAMEQIRKNVKSECLIIEAK